MEDKMKKFEILEQKMCKELETLSERYAQGNEMSVQDLDKIDKLVHALKSMATYKAMKEAEEYEGGMSGRGYSGEGNYSGRRGRGMDVRYISRDMNPQMSGYSGYSGGGYNDGYSGHYPMAPYPPDNRW